MAGSIHQDALRERGGPTWRTLNAARWRGGERMLRGDGGPERMCGDEGPKRM